MKKALILVLTVIALITAFTVTVFATEAKIGETEYATLEAAISAANDGDEVVLLKDVYLDKDITIKKSITVDGQGFKLLPLDENAKYNSAIMVGDSNLGDSEGTLKISLKNIVFEGFTALYGVLRIQGVDVTVEGCTFRGNSLTGGSAGSYSVLSSNYSNTTVKNCVFENNNTRALDVNINADDSNSSVTVDGCTFKGNTTANPAIVHRNAGKLYLSNSKFINNNIETDLNAATVYVGFGTGSSVKGCYFEGNTVVTKKAVATRIGSAIFCDGADINGNVFGEGNTAAYAGGPLSYSVAIGAYYGVPNISGNYWQGHEPVLNVDYMVEYSKYDVVCNGYYDSYKENENGTYTVYNIYVAQVVGGIKYETLTAAIAAANNGDEVVLLDNVSLSEILTISKPITLNGNGKTLTSTAGRAINVETTGSVTIKNLTISAKGERAINIINQPVNVTLSGVTATASNNAVMLATSSVNSVLVIEDSYLSGLATVNVAGPNAVVTITDTAIINNDNTEKETYGAITVYNTATNATVTVNGGSISVMGDSKAVANFASANVTFNGTEGNLDSHDVVAMVGVGGYTTLAGAINGAKGETIKLVSDIVLTETLVIAKDKNVTIDLNGHNITYLVEAATGNTYAIENNGTLTVKDTSESQNGEICLTYTGARVNHSISTICNRGTVNVVSGGINAVSGNQYISYAIDNNNTISDAVINVSGGYVIGGASYYSIRLYANSTKNENALNVTGGTIYFVWLQAPNASANKASISVSGGLTYYVYVSTADGSVADCSNYKVSLDSEYMEYDPDFVNLKDGYYVDNTNGVYEIKKYAEISDIVTFKGYSYNLYDGRIVASFTVNHDSLKAYVSENGVESYDFGSVLAVETIGADAKESTLASYAATKNYFVFINEITEEYYDLGLVICMYVEFDGEKKYVTVNANKETVFVGASDVMAVTYNQIVGGNN